MRWSSNGLLGYPACNGRALLDTYRLLTVPRVSAHLEWKQTLEENRRRFKPRNRPPAMVKRLARAAIWQRLAPARFRVRPDWKPLNPPRAALRRLGGRIGGGWPQAWANERKLSRARCRRRAHLSG